MNVLWPMPHISCVVCAMGRPMPASKDGRPRTPRGWKVLRGETYCATCKQTAFSLRALILPVAAPEDRSWVELRDQLRAHWSDTTRCANWLATELYARDLRRQPEDQRLGPMPHIYLYPEARALFPHLPAQAVAALAQEVQHRYRANRYALLWTRSASLATYRYPVALTIPAQAWSLYCRDGRWGVSVRLSDSRWPLLLRGGPGMHRQAERLKQLAAGDAERGSLTIYESAAPGSGRSRVMVKLAAWFPKAAAADRQGVLHVGTDRQSLLACERRWRIDPAPLRAVLAAEARRRSSLLANLHVARGSIGRRSDGIERALAELARRSRQRIAEACRTYAADLVAHAVSRGVREVHYDDSVRPELAHFPWEQLRRRVVEKLNERSIRFVHVNARGAGDEMTDEEGGEHAA